MKKFLFGAFAAVCAAFSLAAVNINTASSAELEALPGIGPAKAKSIVEYRQKNGAFKSVEELKNVKGIGDAVLNKLRRRRRFLLPRLRPRSLTVKNKPDSACMPPCGRTVCRLGPGRLCLGAGIEA